MKKKNTEIGSGVSELGSRNFDIEDRLIDFTCRMIEVIESLPATRTGNYLASQLIRSCHSPSLNYGEVQATESNADFIHKLCVCLKELKECRVGLKIIMKKQLIKPVTKLLNVYSENEQLIAIIGKSISTAKKTNS
jgi:four helix bundle protein